MMQEPPLADAGLFGLNTNVEDAEILIIGVPWEATASYGRGSSMTPAQIIPASHQLDFYTPILDREFGAEVAMEPARPEWSRLNTQAMDAVLRVRHRQERGLEPHQQDLEIVNTCSRTLNRDLGELAGIRLARGKFVAVLGGDHSAPLGLIKAVFERKPKAGILHIDAHHDLRAAYEGFVYSHASIMYNVLKEVNPSRLVSVGIRDYSQDERRLAEADPRVETFYDRDLSTRLARGESWALLCDDIIATLPDEVYISLDVDGLTPALCPHTGTPVPGGLNWAQITYLLEHIPLSGRRIVGFDLCEASPNLKDPEDEWDLNVAARLLHLLCVLAHRGTGRS